MAGRGRLEIVRNKMMEDYLDLFFIPMPAIADTK